MLRIKERIKDELLRQFGDEGADTLANYMSQVQYSAFWCMRLLSKAHGITKVIPEGVEDLVVCRGDRYELRQVKTRTESVGTWKISDVLPILCKQFSKRHAFYGKCTFHFVSNQSADNQTRFTATSYGPLYRLKFLLDLRSDGQTFSGDEQKEWDQFETRLLPKIIDRLKADHEEEVDEEEARKLLCACRIETEEARLRSFDWSNELNLAFEEALPGHEHSVRQLERVYLQLIMLVITRIVNASSVDARTILKEDVLSCRGGSQGVLSPELNLDDIPGGTLLEKKCYLGRFDLTSIPNFKRQKLLTEQRAREFEMMGHQGEVDKLAIALVDLQDSLRYQVYNEGSCRTVPGPEILKRVRPQLSAVVKTYFSDDSRFDEQFCLGLLWRETDQCYAWWHNPHDVIASEAA